MSGIFAGAGRLIVYGGLYFNVSTTALVTIELFLALGGLCAYLEQCLGLSTFGGIPKGRSELPIFSPAITRSLICVTNSSFVFLRALGTLLEGSNH